MGKCVCGRSGRVGVVVVGEQGGSKIAGVRGLKYTPESDMGKGNDEKEGESRAEEERWNEGDTDLWGSRALT